jgi:hypothetical protein
VAESREDIPEIIRTTWDAMLLAAYTIAYKDGDLHRAVANLLPMAALYLWIEVARNVNQFMEKLPEISDSIYRVLGGRPRPLPLGPHSWRATASVMLATTTPRNVLVQALARPAASDALTALRAAATASELIEAGQRWQRDRRARRGRRKGKLDEWTEKVLKAYDDLGSPPIPPITAKLCTQVAKKAGIKDPGSDPARDKLRRKVYAALKRHRTSTGSGA